MCYLCKANDASDGLGELVPASFFGSQLLASRLRYRVKPGAAIAFGSGPAGADPPFPRHSMERRIERSLFDSKSLPRDGMNMYRDAVPMHRSAAGERLQNQEIKRALKPVVRMFPHNST